ncbi:MAG: glycosyltransferase, partial [Actinomycetota bacterium]
FVGRHMPKKGPQVLLEALVELFGRGIPFRAEFLSDGPLRESLEERTRTAGLSEHVVFRGHVEDVAVEMRRAAIIVRPSFCEGLPLSLMEAMATRLAVVATDVDGNRDLISDGRNGLLVPPGDPASLADALERVLASEALREKLATAACADARAYTWKRCAEETAQSISRAIADRKRGTQADSR